MIYCDASCSPFAFFFFVPTDKFIKVTTVADCFCSSAIMDTSAIMCKYRPNHPVIPKLKLAEHLPPLDQHLVAMICYEY